MSAVHRMHTSFQAINMKLKQVLLGNVLHSFCLCVVVILSIVNSWVSRMECLGHLCCIS